MDINQAKDYIFAIARKNQIGNIPINQLNLYFERAQLEIVSALRNAYQINSITGDNLSPLVQTAEIYNSGDRFLKPSDHMYWVDIYANAYTNSKQCGVSPDKEWVPIELIPQNKLAYRQRSTIVKAATMYPVAVDYDTYYLVMPVPDKIQLTYIRTPKPPKWNYIDTGLRPVYTSIGSQDFELPDITHQDICYKVLSYMGIATRDADLYQTTNNGSNN